MRPMTRRDPETADPMHIEPARGAVQHEGLKLAFEIGLHLEQQSIITSANLRVSTGQMQNLGCETAGATWVDGEPLRSPCSAASSEGHDGESGSGAWV
jgi:hypothetical protein